MADMSCTLNLVLIILVSTFLKCHVLAGVMCYSCDSLPHQRDCDRVVECGDSEECYGERLVSPDGLITFRSGCKGKDMCAIVQGPILGRKRAPLIPCSKCCNTPYCNLETCDIPATSNRKRCMSCEYALTPTDCHLTIQCNEDEVCYSQSIIHNQEKRYRLGCVHKNQCGVIPDITAQPVGKRATDDYCGQCCSGNNCNRELCAGNNITMASLVKPPPLRFCRDVSASQCASKVNLCSQDYYKFYQCPATCGQLTPSPGTTSPPITTVSTEKPTLAPGECRDNPAYKCTSLVCQFVPDVAKECRVTCNSCNVTTKAPVTTIATQPTATPNPTQVKVCDDPIPACQCHYLEKEARICEESESVGSLRKLCCHYCEFIKTKGQQGCSSRCNRIEQSEFQKLGNMTIKCIDPSLG